MKHSKKLLGLFQIVMINIIAVASIRSLPFSASYGASLLFFYFLAALLFFIPSALVSAELGTGWPTTGGIYIWVREAFGKRLGLLVIWMSWVYNLAWYPTIMALIAGTTTYFFNPEMAENKIYMLLVILGLFWAATLLNCFGMRVSSLISTIGALVGTILPMCLISALGLIWIVSGNPLQIGFSNQELFPAWSTSLQLPFLASLLFGLLGLEMAATHAQEMHNPKRDYPKAVAISAVLILFLLISSSLSIALVVPKSELSLVTGTLQAFSQFFAAYQISWMVPFIAGCVILGGLSGVSAWIISPTKGLMVACRDGSLPKSFGKTNQHGVPYRILIVQALIVSVLSCAFLLMPNVNASFWLLSTITAQLALLVYMGLFAAALRLHYSKPDVSRSFRIPGGKVGIWSVSLVGSFTCLSAILFGFLPPEGVGISSVLSYEATLITGILILSFIPYALCCKFRK